MRAHISGRHREAALAAVAIHSEIRKLEFWIACGRATLAVAMTVIPIHAPLKPLHISVGRESFFTYNQLQINIRRIEP